MQFFLTNLISIILKYNKNFAGGIYFIISRSLGPEFGASVGIVFAFANAVAASMNTIGFCDSMNDLLKEHNLKIIDNGIQDVRIIGTIALIVMILICGIGMEWESKVRSFVRLCFKIDNFFCAFSFFFSFCFLIYNLINLTTYFYIFFLFVLYIYQAQNFLIAVIVAAIFDFLIGTIVGPKNQEQISHGFIGFSCEYYIIYIYIYIFCFSFILFH